MGRRGLQNQQQKICRVLHLSDSSTKFNLLYTAQMVLGVKKQNVRQLFHLAVSGGRRDARLEASVGATDARCGYRFACVGLCDCAKKLGKGGKDVRKQL